MIPLTATRLRLHGLLKQVHQCRAEIEKIAKENITDVPFLDYVVQENSHGSFWDCDDSPIGVCVFKISDNGKIGSCHYCHNPLERK